MPTTTNPSTPNYAIIEVQPNPQWGPYVAESFQAYPTGTTYKPSTALNVRSGPGIQHKIIGVISGGQSVIVYTKHSWTFATDSWLNLSPPDKPARWVAYQLEGQPFGVVQFPK